MKRVLFAGEINVDLVLQGYTEFPVPGKEVLVEDSQLVLGSATAILAMGLMLLAGITITCGLILDSVSRSRREIKRLHYQSLPAVHASSTPAARVGDRG